MDELIEAILEMTKEMKYCLEEEMFAEFEQLLNDRHVLMNRVNVLKNEEVNFEYSQTSRQRLEEIQVIDRQLAPLLEKNIMETKALIGQMKRQKQVSKQYNPYIKQTNGVFLDSKR